MPTKLDHVGQNPVSSFPFPGDEFLVVHRGHDVWSDGVEQKPSMRLAALALLAAQLLRVLVQHPIGVFGGGFHMIGAEASFLGKFAPCGFVRLFVEIQATLGKLPLTRYIASLEDQKSPVWPSYRDHNTDTKLLRGHRCRLAARTSRTARVADIASAAIWGASVAVPAELQLWGQRS